MTNSGSRERAEEKMEQGMLFRYPTSSWCRHGLAIVIGQRAYDTYWGEYGDAEVSESELSNAELLGNIDTEFHKSTRDTCNRHDDKDVIYIPLGGSSERWYLRNDASPVTEKVIAQLESKLAGEESTIRLATRRAAELREELEVARRSR